MRYFFDVKSANGIVQDPDGQVFNSDDESIEAAKREALGLAGDHFRDGSAVQAKTIVIRVANGLKVAEINVSTVVKDYLD